MVVETEELGLETSEGTTSRKRVGKKPKIRTVKKRMEDGEFEEVESRTYSASLGRQFNAQLQEAESIKEFKAELKQEPELKGAHKEHCKRKRFEVKCGKTFWDYVETAVMWSLIGLGGYAGVITIVSQVQNRRAEKELEA